MSIIEYNNIYFLFLFLILTLLDSTQNTQACTMIQVSCLYSFADSFI